MFKIKKNPVLEKFAHYLTAFVVILKGIDKAEHFHEHPFVSIFLILLGVILLLATVFHHTLEKKVKEFKTVLFTCEGLSLLLVSYYFFASGKKLLPSVYLACGIAFLIMAYVFYLRKSRRLAAGNNGQKSEH